MRRVREELYEAGVHGFAEPMNLDRMLKPKTVALLGASSNPEKVGNNILHSLLRNGPRIYPVNPSEKKVMGLKCYRSVLDIEDEIDLAILAIGAKLVVPMVKECAIKGIPFVIIVAGGFSEIGPEGKAIEEELKEAISGTGTRILGPNTMGVLVPGKLDTFFLPPERSPRPAQGEIAIVSQSGSLLMAAYEVAQNEGLGLRACVGIGNKVDLNENDFLDHFKEDEQTKCVTFYLESFHDGKRFLELAKETATKKPVVVAKAGATERGAMAASSHTGALAASSSALVSGVLRQAGIVRVRDERELLDASKALAFLGSIPGDRIVIIGSTGGFGVIATDYVTSTTEGFGMKLADLSEDSKRRIKMISPYFASVSNPVDLTGAVTNEMHDQVLEAVQDDPGVDAVLMIMQFQPPKLTPQLADIVIKWSLKGKKPIMVCCVGGSYPLPVLRRMDALGVPSYGSIRQAVFALRCLADRGRYLAHINQKG